MSHPNDILPSAADSMGEDARALSRKVEETAAAVESLASALAERGAQAYRSGNETLAAHVPPLPGLAIAAVAGFIAGCIWMVQDRA